MEHAQDVSSGNVQPISDMNHESLFFPHKRSMVYNLPLGGDIFSPDLGPFCNIKCNPKNLLI